MKIAFFGVSAEDHSFFKDNITGSELVFFNEKLDTNNIKKAADAEMISVFVDCKVTKEVIDALPELKFIATRSTGFDHIDCEYAASKGIKVSNVPGFASSTVAEFTFALLLTLSRKIISGNKVIEEASDFNRDLSMQGFDLYSKTLGVIGTGKIGKNVINIAKGFCMNVVATDMHPDAAFAKENNFEYVDLAELISTSDIISIHVPYTKENHHLINKENISKMKRGVYLINTARGELVDTDALVAGLQGGIIAGAGLDVLEGEKDLKDNNNTDVAMLNKKLMHLPNVLITPHIAAQTREALMKVRETTVANIQSFLSGIPTNVVN